MLFFVYLDKILYNIIGVKMNGIILIDKPSGITSYDVIRRLKTKIKGHKIGHAGTLDPLASGLLIILVGRATKLSGLLMADHKTYTGTILFGNNYDSYDVDGTIIESKTPTISSSDVDRGFQHFNNLTYDQVPPIYSALKVDGKKAYELARSNEEVVLKPRTVTINKFVKTSEYKNYEVSFLADVSKQTYIRSLAYDLGCYLGEFAALKALRRLSVGPFNVRDATSIDNYKLISIEEYFTNYPSFKFDNFTTNLVKNGVWLDSRQTNIKSSFVILDQNDKVIALYEPTSDGRYRPKIMF